MTYAGDEDVLASWIFPQHVSPTVAKAALELARDIGKNGVGEGQPAHGFTFAVVDGDEMMRLDNEGIAVYGEPHDENLVFSSKPIELLGLAGSDKRLVLTEVTKDLMILIDGRNGTFVASNYSVNNLRRGDKAGGARHKAASAMAQFEGGNFVVKVSEAVCRASVKDGLELDVFLGARSPTKFALVPPSRPAGDSRARRAEKQVRQLKAQLARAQLALRREAMPRHEAQA